MTKRFALDVYDMIHVFGYVPFSFLDWRNKFRRQHSFSTADRSWCRMKDRLNRLCVPHERVFRHTDRNDTTERLHLRFNEETLAMINEVLR